MGAAKDMLTSALFFAVAINLFFVVVWEVGFYFMYITKREDDISRDMSQRMVDLFCTELWQVVKPIPALVRAPLVQAALLGMNSMTSAVQKDDAQEKERQKHNNRLFYYSLAMCGSFLVLVIIFGIMCGVNKRFPDQKHMWLELFVVMVGFAGFDFFFFDYIVKNFIPISPGRFQSLMLKPIIDNGACFPVAAGSPGMLTSDDKKQSFSDDARELREAGKQLIQLAQASTSIDELHPVAARLRALLPGSDGAPPGAARAPPSTPSMPLAEGTPRRLREAGGALQGLAGRLRSAGTLRDHYTTIGHRGEAAGATRWVPALQRYVGALAGALETPDPAGVDRALQGVLSGRNRTMSV